MPLSEHEQRLLEQMERALYAEDPKFASALEGTGLRTYTRRRVYQAAAGFVVGIALLMGGMVAQQIWVSVVGFLVMLGCAVLAVTGWRRGPVGHGAGPKVTPPPRRKAGVMDRMEQRWQRRRDEQDGI
ncbi:spore wall synthesis complex protein [Kitasatospora kazusensis]|uniref:Spore wall synthesis complex protein n=1 Tax=Kitasatospora kazusensis TaxID=407974 RepID=A0ABN3A4H1_9ACTN